jgi:hypothetical protein
VDTVTNLWGSCEGRRNFWIIDIQRTEDGTCSAESVKETLDYVYNYKFFKEELDERCELVCLLVAF